MLVKLKTNEKERDRSCIERRFNICFITFIGLA